MNLIENTHVTTKTIMHWISFMFWIAIYTTSFANTPGLRMGRLTDGPSTLVDLGGILGPFQFDKFCRFESGETLIVDGGGYLHHLGKSGEETVKRIADRPLNGIFFSTNKDGWVVGERGLILHTVDGGNSWAIQESRVDVDLSGGTCVNQRICWVVGKNGTLLKSAKGSGWVRVFTRTEKNLNSVSFLNTNNGWIAGDDGLILHTTGDGIWVHQRAEIILYPDGPFRKRADLRTVRFVNDTYGWVAGSGGIAKTIDGGKTWTTSYIEDSFIGLVMQDDKVGLAVTDRGCNYATSDGGEDWHLVRCPT